MANIGAIEGVRQAFHRYALGFDEDDFELFEDCFTEDAVFSTATVGPIQGRADIRAYFKQRRDGRRSRGEQSRHLITNVALLEEDATSVLAVAYVTAVVAVRGAQPSMHFGWYRDRLVSDGHVWRIREHYIHADGADHDELIRARGGTEW